MAPTLPDADRDSVSVGRHPPYHRNGDGNGLGAHPVRIFAPVGNDDGARAGGPRGILAVTIAVFAILGSVLEGIPAIVLFGPLLFPAARALGVHDVHYAMVVI